MPDIVAIIEKCLAKNRHERYQSAAELSADLKRALALLDGQTAAPVMKKTASDVSSLATIVEENLLPTQPEPAVVPQSVTSLKPTPSQDAQPKARSNTTRNLIAGGAVVFLLCAVAGVTIFRNLSARNAPVADNESVLETVTPSILEATKTPKAEKSPTVESVVEIQHLVSPSVTVDAGRIVFDVESVDTSPEKRAPYGDS